MNPRSSKFEVEVSMKRFTFVLTGLIALGLVGGGCKKEEKPDQVIVAASQKARDGGTEASMRTLARAETAYQASHGKYGTIPEMVESGELAFNPSSDKTSQFSCEGSETEFSCYGTPSDYPRTGRFSYFIDQTGTLRGGDKNGGKAFAGDPVIEK
jgi:hypothetical protein